MSAPETAGSSIRVTDHPDQRQYLLEVDGERIGLVGYARQGDLLALLHTEIDPHHEEHGLGSALVAGVLDDARSHGAAVLPFCPFVSHYLSQHPDDVALVPEALRADFGLADR